MRSRGAELGLRAAPLDGVRSTVALWALDLGSELLFVGDAGTTEPSAASRRRGVTFANVFRSSPSLTLDADLSVAHARFAGVPAAASRIPGALEKVVAGGVTWTSVRRGPYGALRVRHFGAYPLTEDNGVRSNANFTFAQGVARSEAASESWNDQALRRSASRSSAPSRLPSAKPW